MEKNKREERAGVKSGVRERRRWGKREGGWEGKEESSPLFNGGIMDSAGMGPTCMFNDRECQRVRSLCEPANVSTAPECSCAHLARGGGAHKTLQTVNFQLPWMELHRVPVASLCRLSLRLSVKLSLSNAVCI